MCPRISILDFVRPSVAIIITINQHLKNSLEIGTQGPVMSVKLQKVVIFGDFFGNFEQSFAEFLLLLSFFFVKILLQDILHLVKFQSIQAFLYYRPLDAFDK